MKINVHAGHGKDGAVGCGAVGLIKESTEARKVKDLVIKYLKAEGHTVYDCTVDTGKDASDILKKIVKKCNAHTVDLDVSIHFNSGVSDPKGNDKTTGTEVLIYNSESKAYDEAKRVCDKIAKLGFKNRGVKTRSDLYFLNSSKAAAILIEVCFVGDKDDVTLYQKNVDNIAKAIVEGIQNKAIKKAATSTTKSTSSKSKTVVVENAKSFDKKLADTYVTTSSLNLRYGAGTDKDIITTIKSGTKVRCYGYYTAVNGVKWYLVVYDKYNGFLSSKYLK